MTTYSKEKKERGKVSAERQAAIGPINAEQVTPALMAAWRTLYNAHRELIGRFEQVRALLAQAGKSGETLDLNNFADWAYLCREVQTWADDIRKDAYLTQRYVERWGCLRYLDATINDVDPQPLRGKLATASPDVKTMANLPTCNADPENWEKLARHFGCIKALRNGVAKFHFTGLAKWITKLQAAGKPLPPGMPNTYDHYWFYPLRKRNDTSLEAMTDSD